jgi:hypothetical protein
MGKLITIRGEALKSVATGGLEKRFITNSQLENKRYLSAYVTQVTTVRKASLGSPSRQINKKTRRN